MNAGMCYVDVLQGSAACAVHSLAWISRATAASNLLAEPAAGEGVPAGRSMKRLGYADAAGTPKLACSTRDWLTQLAGLPTPSH